MPVIFKCKCGQYFTAPNSLINKEFTCLQCNIQNKVPNPFVAEVKEDALDALFPEEPNKTNSEIFDGRRCQYCGAKIASNQTTCNLCGLELSEH